MSRLLVLFMAILGVTIDASVQDVDKWPKTENDHTKLQVIIPQSLHVKGGYPHKDALFGYPSYSSGSLQTQLVYANSTACSPLDTSTWPAPPFALLIDRGECHFVEKVRRAQHAGARAVLIGDNKCLCTDSSCMRHTGDRICESVLPYMADDDSGGDISIPSMLIRKSDAENLKKVLSENKGKGLSNIMVKFDWGIPSPDGRVEWTMWHSAWDEQSLKTLKEMEKIVLSLGSRAFFTPRFASYNGSRVGCTSTGSSSRCGNMCLNKGRYCLLDPSPQHNQRTGASGLDVVVENLRRKCLWRHVTRKKEEQGVGRIWWRYVNLFGAVCNRDEEHFKQHECSASILKKLGVDPKDVEKCMAPYGENVDKVNPLLEEELSEQTGLQLLRLPALYVDGVHERGRINGAGILGMICGGYGTHQPPAVCECVNQSPIGMMECVKQGSYSKMVKNDEKKRAGLGVGGVLTIVLFVVAAAAGAGFVYWRRQQRQMREQVRSILAEYMPLEDQSCDSPRLNHPAVVASIKSPRGFEPSNAFDDDEDGV